MFTVNNNEDGLKWYLKKILDLFEFNPQSRLSEQSAQSEVNGGQGNIKQLCTSLPHRST